MKDQKSSIFTTLLMAIILVVAGACHEDDENDKTESVSISDIKGIIEYNNNLKAYVFTPDDWYKAIPNYHMGFEGPIYNIIIKNGTKEDLEQYSGKKVSIAGTIKYDHSDSPKGANPDFGVVEYYYILKLSQIYNE